MFALPICDRLRTHVFDVEVGLRRCYLLRGKPSGYLHALVVAWGHSHVIFLFLRHCGPIIAHSKQQSTYLIAIFSSLRQGSSPYFVLLSGQMRIDTDLQFGLIGYSVKNLRFRDLGVGAGCLKLTSGVSEPATPRCREEHDLLAFKVCRF